MHLEHYNIKATMYILQGVSRKEDTQPSSSMVSATSERSERTDGRSSQDLPNNSASRNEYRPSRPSLSRTDVKDTPLNHSDGDRDKTKDTRVVLDKHRRPGSVDSRRERRTKLNPRKEFEEMNKCIEDLMVSNERTKRELLKIKSTVERFKVEVDSQRVISKTKEFEAILLTNENARLKEEIDELREIIAKNNTENIKDERSKSVARTDVDSKADQRVDSSLSDHPNPCDDIRRGKYVALAPISKPRIFRRSTLDDARTDRDTEMGTKKHQTSKQNEHGSHSDTCAVKSSSNKAESSVSASNVHSDSDTHVVKERSNVKKRCK